MVVSGWLIDKSALVRLASSEQSEEWASRLSRGLVQIATVTRLEVGFSARSHAELQQMINGVLASMPVAHQTPAIDDRAVELQIRLAERGSHRAPSVPDLLIAAIAELNGLTVLHQDKDFELIAEITGQPTERLIA